MAITLFYEKLRGLRLARGLSLRAMAEAFHQRGVNISHTGIARWEQQRSGEAQHLPKRQTIAALAKFFDVSPAWLLEDVYSSNSRTTNNNRRQDQMQELALLSDSEFEIVVAIKDQIIATRNSAIAVPFNESGDLS
ncbi:MAG: helix-turn-helix transcriptional regulator [Gammaproteobacteria bacterium]|nr:helix-turn-helix transcriptional regulator [Gammaproteobacteria bacterium]MBT5603792.1 helix-turn-helix transcriptional regulator [Gammaproteobacteria bacterium]MBT6244392.1 helix-turn-helix transcriptional regulator [Gammaproteobacteria bacterium]